MNDLLRHEDGLFYLAGNNSLEADDILFVMRCISEGKNVFNYDPEACVYACELPLFLPSLLELVGNLPIYPLLSAPAIYHCSYQPL
jgi:hypothetical protein